MCPSRRVPRSSVSYTPSIKGMELRALHSALTHGEGKRLNLQESQLETTRPSYLAPPAVSRSLLSEVKHPPSQRAPRCRGDCASGAELKSQREERDNELE